MQQKEITLGGTTLTINIKEGQLNSGVLYAEGIELSDNGEPAVIILPEQVEWSDDEALENAIRETLEVEKRWPDTSDSEWVDHRLAKPGTQIFEVMEFVYENPFCTSSDIENVLNLEDKVQNVLYSCKNKNLIKTVGRDGSSHILAPTHLAFKEMFLLHNSQGSEESDGDAEDGEE